MKFVGFYCTSLYNACILNYAKVDKEYKDKYYSYFSRIVESTKKWNVNKEYFPAILKYGGYYAIVNNKRWLLELVIKLKNFKKSIRLNV